MARAGVLPFAASHAVVMVARTIGTPERLALDLLHGFIVLGYLTAIVRIAGGQGQGQGHGQGLARFGYAWPRRIRLPAFADMLSIAAVVVMIGLPVALLLHAIVQAAEAWQARADMAVYIPVTMVPEFVMTTLIGLAIAGHGAKMAQPTPE